MEAFKQGVHNFANLLKMQRTHLPGGCNVAQSSHGYVQRRSIPEGSVGVQRHVLCKTVDQGILNVR